MGDAGIDSPQVEPCKSRDVMYFVLPSVAPDHSPHVRWLFPFLLSLWFHLEPRYRKGGKVGKHLQVLYQDKAVNSRGDTCWLLQVWLGSVCFPARFGAHLSCILPRLSGPSQQHSSGRGPLWSESSSSLDISPLRRQMTRCPLR